jgi:hypothetical protein
MSEIWGTAEMLLAMAGDAGAAAAAARGMAEDCAGSPGECAYWLDVAWAVAWLSNPQPLIAPEPPPAPGDVVRPFRGGGGRGGKRPDAGAAIHRLEQAVAKLPSRRTRIATLQRRLRAAFEEGLERGRGRRGGKPAPKGKI